MALFTLLLPSLTRSLDCGFRYEYVLGYDKGDAFYDSEEVGWAGLGWAALGWAGLGWAWSQYRPDAVILVTKYPNNQITNLRLLYL